LSAKKSCSPAVQINSLPQSTHASVLSWNSIGSYLSPTRARPFPRPPQCSSRHRHGNGPPSQVLIDLLERAALISPASS
jgi:hypothetical protein